MSNQKGVEIGGNFVPFAELRADVAAAREKGLASKWAFTPETVDALLNYIEGNIVLEVKQKKMSSFVLADESEALDRLLVKYDIDPEEFADLDFGFHGLDWEEGAETKTFILTIVNKFFVAFDAPNLQAVDVDISGGDVWIWTITETE